LKIFYFQFKCSSFWISPPHQQQQIIERMKKNYWNCDCISEWRLHFTPLWVIQRKCCGYFPIRYFVFFFLFSIQFTQKIDNNKRKRAPDFLMISTWRIRKYFYVPSFIYPPPVVIYTKNILNKLSFYVFCFSETSSMRWEIESEEKCVW
jgi:hypothetical protein